MPFILAKSHAHMHYKICKEPASVRGYTCNKTCKHALQNIHEANMPSYVQYDMQTCITKYERDEYAILHANMHEEYARNLDSIKHANMHYKICQGRICRYTCNKTCKHAVIHDMQITCKHALQNIQETHVPLYV